MESILPIRSFRGPLDRVLVYSLPAYEGEVKGALLLWSQMGLPVPLMVYPGQQYRLLATTSYLRQPPPNWHALISNESVGAVRGRIPGLRPK